METIVKILMKRDGMTRTEAIEVYEETRSEIMDALNGTSVLDPEEVLIGELGLEVDYIFYFL